ncbi:c-Myc-binding protein-like, partial [Centruroides sculpturatus]|uniref:c-Myc-binding protein-like n=1 Tax=Centruroides sculpturatus TaxID=218467 RepID=UPI000C6E1113
VPRRFSRRDEFREYLQSVGIYDSLTKALSNLYEEQGKPEDPLIYIKQQLGINDSNNMESLKQQLIQAKQKLEELKKENSDLLVKMAS